MIIGSRHGLGDGSVTLGPQGSAKSAAQAAADYEAQRLQWNAASQAASPSIGLTVSDYLAPGDSLSNWPAGVTPTDIINWYVAHAQTVWLAPDGTRTTTLPAGNAAQGYIRTGDYVFTTPNGAVISTPGGGQMADPWGVGATAILNSPAANIYKAAFFAGGGSPSAQTPGAPGVFYNTAPASTGSGASTTGVNYALQTVNDGLQNQEITHPSTAANLPAGSTANDVAAANGLSASTVAASLASTVSGWSTQTWLLVAAAAAAGLYMFSSKGSAK